MKYLISLFLLVACASKPGQLTEEGQKLENYATKPADCRVLGKVVGTDKTGTKELAINSAMNQASKLGASGIFVNQEVPNGQLRTVYATAYKCD